MTVTPPPQLHAYLARNADRAVILRRGPTRWVRLILWDTAADRFEGGQWFHGRVYEDKCHLSPDGQIFVYFATKRGDIWTAVSKPPYFTALALWPQAGTYGGGGFFLPDQRLVLHTCKTDLAAGFSLGPLRIAEESPGWNVCKENDGWAPIDISKPFRGRWAKQHPRLPLRIEYEAWGKRYAVSDRQSLLFETEWADFDRRGRLVYSSAGKLLARSWNHRGKESTIELADFSEDRVTQMEAPPSAQRW